MTTPKWGGFDIAVNAEDVSAIEGVMEGITPPKIFIPVSHNGNCDVKSGYAVDLASGFVGCHVRIEEMGGSHADRQCNNMANQFLRTDCDIMAIIDCDTRFTGKDVQRALAALARGHKAVWGVYPKKQDEAPPCVNTWPEVPPADEFGLVNVRRAGRGFLFIKREVFEALKEDNGGPALRFHNHDQIEWAFFRSGVVAGRYSPMLGDKDADGYPIREWITEDWWFCEDLRNELGIPTLVDTGIVLKHIGSKTYEFLAKELIRVDGWHSVPGWFTDADAETYRKIAKAIPTDGVVAEMGTWMGRSMSALVEFCREEGKMPTLHGIDTFKGTLSEGDAHTKIVAAHGGSIRSVFVANMEKIGASVNIHEAESLAACAEFSDSELDALFIDGDHAFEAVDADVKAWLPKVKSGGIIAGHDYDYPEVRAAVHRHIDERNIETVGRCWVHRKT